MCMDEFVKRLYDFMSIYRTFWSQNSHYRYLPIFYRYFFSEIPTHTHKGETFFFLEKRPKNR